MEHFNSWLFKNLETNSIVFHYPPWNCPSVAPKPLCEASVFSFMFSLMSKWLFSVKFTFSDFNFSNAKFYLLSHWYTDCLLSKGRSGEFKSNNFATNLLYSLIKPKNGRSSDTFSVWDFFIASVFLTIGLTPSS